MKVQFYALIASFTLSLNAFADDSSTRKQSEGAVNAMTDLAVLGTAAIVYKYPPEVTMQFESTNGGSVGGIKLENWNKTSKDHVDYKFKLEQGNWSTTWAELNGCIPLPGTKIKALIGASGHDTINDQLTQGNVGVCFDTKSGNTYLSYGGGYEWNTKANLTDSSGTRPFGLHHDNSLLTFKRITPIGEKAQAALRLAVGRGLGFCDQFKVTSSSVGTHNYDAQKDLAACNGVNVVTGEMDFEVNRKLGRGDHPAVLNLELDQSFLHGKGKDGAGTPVTVRDEERTISLGIGIKTGRQP